MYLFFLTLWRVLLLAGLALRTPFERQRRISGALLVIAGLPVFLLMQSLHWIGFLIDNIVFRGYRAIEVRAPLFVVGPPRTGTTHLHHVLSADATTTTFRTWECLFGLSITARYVGRGLTRVHRAIGSPFARIGAWLGRRLVARMDDIHPIRPDDPEEDFLAFLPVLACFLMVVPLPGASWLWRLARFDTAAAPREREALMAFYRAAIQRHLYVYGADKRFLSKNASFAGMTDSLLDAFPDARIIATVRDPVAVVGSQLSSLRPALELVGFRSFPDQLRDRFVDLLEHYFTHLADSAARHPGRIAFIENSELRYELIQSIERAAAELGLPLEASLMTAAAASGRTGTKASKHRYSLDEFDLDEATIRSRFAEVYTRFVFDGAKPPPQQETA